MTTKQEYISPKQLICYLDKQAGRQPSEISESIGLAEITVNDYARRVNLILRQNGRDVEHYRKLVFTLVPAAIARLAQLMPDATMSDCIRYLEGTQTLSKNLTIQHNIINADLSELMQIVRQQAGDEAQYAEVVEIIEEGESDGVLSSVGDSNSSTVCDSGAGVDGSKHVLRMGGDAQEQCIDGVSRKTHVQGGGTDGVDTNNNTCTHSGSSSLAMGEYAQAGEANQAVEGEPEWVSEGSTPDSEQVPVYPQKQGILTPARKKNTEGSTTCNSLHIESGTGGEKNNDLADGGVGGDSGGVVGESGRVERPPKKYWWGKHYEIDGKYYRCDGSDWNEERGDWDYRLVEAKKRGRKAGRRYMRKRRSR